MPDRLACDEAMNLSKVRLTVQDADLKNGEVEKTVAGVVPVPWGLQGGFAVVYKFRTQSGKVRALRCYLTPMKADIQYRYERISAYFAKHIPDITAEFKYHRDGILIKETHPGKPVTKKPYSLIEMEWIEGVTLIEHLAMLCQRRDQAGLTDMLQQWVAIIRVLRQAKIAHCDLAGGNVMVRSNGRLVLVDYDGVYIPEFAGMLGIVEGQADYQHRAMDQRPFDEQADNFSAMVIYAAILALHIQPALWKTYTSQNTQNRTLDTNILFRKNDFANPDASPLFTELEKINDARLSAIVKDLKQACRLPITQVQLSPQVGNSELDKKEAIAKLEQSLQQDDEAAIVKAWIPALLDDYEPAQKYQTRLIRAREILQKLKNFHAALQTGLIQQIIAAYDPRLDQSKGVSPDERELLRLAYKFQEAYNNDDDDALIAIQDEMRNSKHASSFTLTRQETQRCDLAQRRKAKLAAFRQALAHKHAQEIVDTYDPVLDILPQIIAEERAVLRLAENFVRAYKNDDDQDILDARKVIQSSHNCLNFTVQEEQRISLAKRRMAALEAFRQRLMTRSVQHIVEVYDPVLDNTSSLTYKERDLLSVAKDFVQATRNDDDQAIVASSDVIMQYYQRSLTFTEQEEERISRAHQNVAALTKFRQALADKSVKQIVIAYDPLLRTCKNVTIEEWEQFALATDLVQAYQEDSDEAIVGSWQDIQNSRYQQAFVLTTTEEQRLMFAQQRMGALQHFRTIMNMHSRDATQIVSAYDPILDDCSALTQEERNLLQAACYAIHMHTAVLSGIQNDNDEEILAVYHEGVAQLFPSFNEQQQQRIRKALKRGLLEQALQQNDYGTAIRVAQELEMASHRQIADIRLTLARRRFIGQFEAKNVVAWRQYDDVIVQWQWPSDDLVRYAVIVWRTDQQWPQGPKREELGTRRETVFRNHNEQRCTVRFKAERYMAVYLQVYFALPDYTQQPPTWFYSDGSDPSSRTAAYYSGPDTKVI